MPSWVGLTLATVGELCIALMVLRVHRDVLREHKIGKKTEKDLRMEMTVGVVGIACILAGYFLQLFAV